MRSQENSLFAFCYKRGPLQITARRTWLQGMAATIGALVVLIASPVLAQSESAQALVQRSSIVVSGKVVRVNASMEPLQAVSPRTVVIMITRMYAGAEIAGDQKGQMATVILSQPTTALAVGKEALFFGNPRFVGKSLTIAGEGELLADAARAAKNDLEVALQSRRDRPFRERVTAASSIFRGMVESERDLGDGADDKDSGPESESEHDPEWHVASVRVVAAISGAQNDALVNVIFPASRDVMWFKSPKLKVGQEAIFITHKADKGDTRLMKAPGVAEFLERQTAEVVSEPSDTLPVADEARVRNLLVKRN